MELQRPHDIVLPSLQEHDPSQLVLPAVPSHDIGAAQRVQLPCLKSILSPEFEESLNKGYHSRNTSDAFSSHGTTTPIPMLPRIEPGDMFMKPLDRQSSSEASSRRVSDHERGRLHYTTSMEDPDVRLAAEALSGLGNPGYTRSPTSQSFHSSPAETLRDDMQIDKVEDSQEPLLQLVAQAHPWVGGTINGSISAYNTTLNYSPHFIKYGANLVEKNIATPVVNTVGRLTGVEDGLRRYLGNRRPSELDTTERLRADKAESSADAMDIDMPPIDESRRTSSETLPAYRPSKPPSYREGYSPNSSDRMKERAPAARSWPSQVAGQIFVTTSGLTVALSITSRRSLQYCLSLLSQATEHVATVTKALSMVLEQYDQARLSWQRQRELGMEKSGEARLSEHDEASRRLAELIKQHCEDIWLTLKNVVNAVSNAAGGALPENARDFVRTQLMSLPQRWHLVSARQAGEGETSRGAHRMIAFATEGLDMMSQVSQVVRATLASAESWLDRVGRGDANRQTFPNEKEQEMINATLRPRPA